MSNPATPRRLTAVRELLSPGSGGPPLREVVEGVGWYPLLVITALNVVDELDRAVFAVFGPNIQDYFGLSDAGLGALVGLSVFAIVVFAVPVGYLGTKRDRPRILKVSAVVWSAFSFATAFAVKLPLLVLTRLGTGFGKASVEPVGRSLLTDYYPPTGWNRVLGIHNAANPLGALIGPLIAAILSLFVKGDGVWRPAFVVLTIPSVAVLLWSLKLREPQSQMVRIATGEMITATGAPSGMGFWEAVRRLVSIRTFRWQLVGVGVLGFAMVGVAVFFNIYLEEVHGVQETGRGLIGVLLASASLIGTLIGGNVGERVFDSDPARSMYLVGGSIAVFSLALGLGVFLPTLWLFLPFAWLAIFFVALGAAPLFAALSAITPPRLRPLMFSLLGVCVALFGGVFGGVVVGMISDATSITWGLASLAPSGVVGGLLMARGGASIAKDMYRAAEDLRTPADT